MCWYCKRFHFTVNPADTVKISISTLTTTVCSGILVTFTASPVNGGSNPGYQWKVNGINAGFKPTNLFLYSLNWRSGIMYLKLKYSMPGFKSLHKQHLDDDGQSDFAGRVSISPSQNPYCAGTTITFTATPNNQGQHHSISGR